MESKGNKQSRYSGVITGAILAGSVLAFAATRGYASSTTVHQASGYGAEVKVGGVASVGPVAVAELPECYPTTATFTASLTSVGETGLVTMGVVTSSASSTPDSSVGSSDVLNINLLGGIITASEIKAVSSSSVSDGVFSFSSAGSIFSSLKVAGLPVSANVAPNTEIKLLGLGSVTLNEQVTYTSSDRASLTVNMIHVRITLGPKAGTEIIVSQGLSYIKTLTIPAAVGGYAYAPQLVAGPVTSGPLVLELIPCFGTDGVVETDSTTATSIPGVLSTGTVTVTGEGNVSKSQAMSQATSSIADANLLSGLLSVTAIDGVATGTTTDGVTFHFTGASTFVGLSVAGEPGITDNVAINTKIAIANLGTLYLNRVQYFADKIKVSPVELDVNATNSLGLPIGAVLTLGVVEAQLHSATIP